MHEPLWTALINGVKTRTTFGLDDGPVAKTGNPRLILICMRAIRVSRLFTLIDTPFTFVESLLRAGSFSILSISIVFARRMRFRGEEETSFFRASRENFARRGRGKREASFFPTSFRDPNPRFRFVQRGELFHPESKKIQDVILDEASRRIFAERKVFSPRKEKFFSKRLAKILEISLLPRFVSVFFLGEIALSNLSILC